MYNNKTAVSTASNFSEETHVPQPADDSDQDSEKSSAELSDFDVDEYEAVKARFIELVERRDSWHHRMVHDHALSKRKLHRKRRQCTNLENELSNMSGTLSKEQSQLKDASLVNKKALLTCERLERELSGAQGALAVANGKLAQIAEVASMSFKAGVSHLSS